MFGSPEYLTALAEIRQLSDTRTAEQTRIALFWAQGAGTITTGGYWNVIATDIINQHDMSEREATHVYALLNAAMFDAKRRGTGPEAGWEVFVAGGRTPTGRDAVEWAREGTERGAGEILLTSMDRDGTEDGYDLELTAAVAEAVSVPVIASGGAGELHHLVEAVRAGADAVLCASMFHYGRYRVGEAKQALAAAGIPVRLD